MTLPDRAIELLTRPDVLAYLATTTPSRIGDHT